MTMRLMTSLLMLGGLGLGGAALAGATASDFKPERKLGANYWNANSALDGKLETAWMVSGESENKGEWVMIDLPKGKIDKIGIVNGFLRDADTFADYARVKEVRVEIFQYSDSQELEPVTGQSTAVFADTSDYQIVDIDDLEITSEGGGKVKITVRDIYPGRDYPNLAVSELKVYLTEFEVATSIVDISDESGDHSRLDLVDDSARTFWAGDAAGASISFEVPGYNLSQVGVQPGPSSYARPKKIRINGNGLQTEHELKNSADVQWFDIPTVSGYNGAWGTISMEILEVYPGSNPQVAIAELDLKASSYDGF